MSAGQADTPARHSRHCRPPRGCGESRCLPGVPLLHTRAGGREGGRDSVYAGKCQLCVWHYPPHMEPLYIIPLQEHAHIQPRSAIPAYLHSHILPFPHTSIPILPDCTCRGCRNSSSPSLTGRGEDGESMSEASVVRESADCFIRRKSSSHEFLIF